MASSGSSGLGPSTASDHAHEAGGSGIGLGDVDGGGGGLDDGLDGGMDGQEGIGSDDGAGGGVVGTGAGAVPVRSQRYFEVVPICVQVSTTPLVGGAPGAVGSVGTLGGAGIVMEGRGGLVGRGGLADASWQPVATAVTAMTAAATPPARRMRAESGDCMNRGRFAPGWVPDGSE